MKYKFTKGWSQLTQSQAREARIKIMDHLNLKTRQSFWNRLNGKIEPKITEMKIIEDVFKEYGIKDIWEN